MDIRTLILTNCDVAMFPGMHFGDDWSPEEMMERYDLMFRDDRVAMLVDGNYQHHIVTRVDQIPTICLESAVIYGLSIPNALWEKLKVKLEEYGDHIHNVVDLPDQMTMCTTVSVTDPENGKVVAHAKIIGLSLQNGESVATAMDMREGRNQYRRYYDAGKHTFEPYSGSVLAVSAVA